MADPDRPSTSATTDSPPVGTPGARPELRSKRPWAMEEMIALEPALVARILADEDAADRLAAVVRRAVERRETVAIVGSGTSEHASMIVAALLVEALPDAAPGSIVSREALDAALDPWPGLCIAVSHEGGTASTATALAAARGAGAATALVTAAPDGAVARSADSLFVTPVVDRSWCHTVGYVSPLAAAAATCAVLTGERLDPAAMEARLQATLREASLVAPGIAEILGRAGRVIPIGSGVDHAAARELALKIEEGAALPAAARDTETLLHGHLAAIDGTAALVFLVADPRSSRRRLERAAQGALSAAALGATVAAILSAEVAERWPSAWTAAGRIVLPDTGRAPLDEDAPHAPTGTLAATVLADALALQALSLAVVHARGRNPDLIGREDPRHQAASDIASAPLPGSASVV